MFFAWDQAELTPVALAVLDQIQADFLRPPDAGPGRGSRRPLGSGSLQRSAVRSLARNVARALVQRGIPEQSVDVEWFGERRPRVPTPDGQREPATCRVEVVFG